MRAMVSLSLILGMILSPIAQAQSQASQSKIYAAQVGRYNKARVVFEQKGSAAFVATYSSLLSRSDRQYLTTNLSAKVTLPALTPTANGFDLLVSNKKISFDLTHLDDGYATVDGLRVVANFGGSLEEITVAIERALKQKNFTDKDFAARVSELLIKKAHASNAVIWVALAAIVGALIFKGVSSSSSKEKKKVEAKKPAFVDEASIPASEPTPNSPSGGQPVTDYDSLVGPHNNPGGVIPPRPAAPSPPETPEDREEIPLSEPKPEDDKPTAEAPAPTKPEMGDVSDDDYKTYQTAFCSPSPADSVAKIMSDILKKHGENFAYYNTQTRSGFADARRSFVKSVLLKMESLRDQKDLHQSYVSFVNKTFKPVPAIDSSKALSETELNKIADELDKRSPEVAAFLVEPSFKKDASGSDVSDPEKSNVEIVFVGGSPVLQYVTKESKVIWRKNNSVPKAEWTTLCKDMKLSAERSLTPPPEPTPTPKHPVEPTVAKKPNPLLTFPTPDPKLYLKPDGKPKPPIDDLLKTFPKPVKPPQL